MQVDNQTLTEFIKNTIQESMKPDYIGWVIGTIGVIMGVVAIIITVYVSSKQKIISHEQKQIEEKLVVTSLKHIRQCLIDVLSHIQFLDHVTNIDQLNDEEKMSEVIHLMQTLERKHYGDFIIKEADFIRYKIDIELYEDIHSLATDITCFPNITKPDPVFITHPPTVKDWKKASIALIDSINKMISRI